MRNNRTTITTTIQMVVFFLAGFTGCGLAGICPEKAGGGGGAW